MKAIVLSTATIFVMTIMSGCAGTKVQYGDANAISTVSTDFGSSDLQQIATTLVESMLTFPVVVEEISTRRPILVIDRIKNKTMQHIDTEAVTDSIRARLLKSGKFRFIDRTTDAQTIDEVRYQQESGLVKKGDAVQFGKQVAPEYMLTGNISEIEHRNRDVRDVYYKFTMNLKNLSTGILEWSDEKEIRKVATRSTFGY